MKQTTSASCSIAPDSRRSDRKSTRLNSSHTVISYAVFCMGKKNGILRNEQVKVVLDPMVGGHSSVDLTSNRLDCQHSHNSAPEVLLYNFLAPQHTTVIPYTTLFRSGPS